MKRISIVASLVYLGIFCAAVDSLAEWPDRLAMGTKGAKSGGRSDQKREGDLMAEQNELERSTPEAQGVSSAAVLGFIDAAERDIDALHSFMLLRHGKVVAEGWWAPYAADVPHMLFSLSKSFTSTAVGMAIEEGLLGLDDPLLSFFPDEAPEEPSENLKEMRVRQLLSMVTGHQNDTMGAFFEREDGDWIRAFLEQPVEHLPGTHFLYNTGATYMLSAIVQKVSGQTLMEYLQPRLFAPLGIEGARWESSPQGINTGGWGLSIKTEDIARFGQLYLQKGVWKGQRLISEEWVAEATARQVSNGSNPESDWHQGYGYKFWRCRHDVYRGDGAFGQYCIVMPEQDAVLAITSGVRDMQAVLDLVWDHLLPAIQAEPLPVDGRAQEKLRKKLATLVLPVQEGEASTPLAAQISGKRFLLRDNEQGMESISLDFDGEGGTIAIRDREGEHLIRCGMGEWVKGMTAWGADEPGPVAASGAWTAADTYTIELCFYATPFRPTITCRFAGEKLFFDVEDNVSFGPTRRPQLVGIVE